MDVNICKHKCNNQCCFDSLFEKDGEWFLYLKNGSSSIVETSVFKIEKPKKKILNFLYKSKETSIIQEYKFYNYYYNDYAYISIDYILRNVHMLPNDFCPYCTEHFLKDIEHERRIKEDKKLRKKKKELRKNGI